MGLLGELVLLPLAPVRGAVWVTGQVVDAAEQEQIAQWQRELVALERELATGGISEEEFDRREDEILDLLEEFDRGVAG
ncbi:MULTISPECIES: gas vesicle protein GvpG [Amycolatopsis]|uniref:Gas vesicle protein GvpG n=1 Tax=Amycolatopsis dendrobii TaxID=2760662 RepID=A0A7W3W2A0_9PSEU|nr:MULTISPECIES: gas vesicle protein GvpG [Amycolatopsis]MBB1157460.1 gas vesicle protein GvpG [Amycolatopsis dendrobii]UKD59146.1 gas vesicle protein GvpG [Amycolatopsis sp. FU40]